MGVIIELKYMVHSNWGCQYTGCRFIQIVKDIGVASIHIAPQESFFGHMKDELADEQPTWRCLEDVGDSIDHWMDYYNGFQWYCCCCWDF